MDAYLCGHDHDLEYLLDAPEGEGVSYFVSGSGGQDVYGVKKTKEVSAWEAPPLLPTHPFPFPFLRKPVGTLPAAQTAPSFPSTPAFRHSLLLSALPPLPPSSQTVFAVAESGFMHHAFLEGGSEMRVDVVNRDGQVLLSKTLRQKREQTVAGGGVGVGEMEGVVVGGEDAVIVEVKHRL